ILAAHRIPYAASISLAHAEDTLRKLRYALDQKGFRFLHVLSPCPTGWKSEAAEGIQLVRFAIKSGLFPVYEVFDGSKVKISLEPESDPAKREEALKEYFSRQGRFQKNEVDLEKVTEAIEANWKLLRMRAQASA
ncbi:MAG: pyruvate synthase subunit beta, partial [Planctomycetota bacterium]